MRDLPEGLRIGGISGDYRLDGRYCAPLADRAVAYLSGLRLTGNDWDSRPLRLQPWQEHLVRATFGLVDDEGSRLIRRVYIFVPKKAGKTTLIGGLALYLLHADGWLRSGSDLPRTEEEFEESFVHRVDPLILGTAPEVKQAVLALKAAAAFVAKDPHDLGKDTKVTKYGGGRLLQTYGAGSYEIISGSADGQAGPGPSAIIFDEIWELADPNVWSRIIEGSGLATRGQLILSISNAGHRNTLAHELYQVAKDPPRRTLGLVFEDLDGDPKEPETWQRANPACGTVWPVDGYEDWCVRAARRTDHWKEFERAGLGRFQEAGKELPAKGEKLLTEEQFEIFEQRRDAPDERVSASELCACSALRHLPLRPPRVWIGVDYGSDISMGSAAAVVWEPLLLGERLRIETVSWTPEKSEDADDLPEGSVLKLPGNMTTEARLKEILLDLAKGRRIQHVSFRRSRGGRKLGAILSVDRAGRAIEVSERSLSEMLAPADWLRANCGEVLHDDGAPLLNSVRGAVLVHLYSSGGLRLDFKLSRGHKDPASALLQAIGAYLDHPFQPNSYELRVEEKVSRGR